MTNVEYIGPYELRGEQETGSVIDNRADIFAISGSGGGVGTSDRMSLID